MIVGGFSYIGTRARHAHVGPAPQAPADRRDERSGAAREAPTEDPTYFRTISAISPGSLAAVYQAMRAHEVSSASETGGVRRGAPDGRAVILSGAGIPVALAAYGEVMETLGEG
jgi:hypothetical protein